MSNYKNFTVDMPQRLMDLDPAFHQIASDRGLEVTYLLMKLSAAFLLPYERLHGTSGASRIEISDGQRIRKYLELDRPFLGSSYVSDPQAWSLLHTDDFQAGPTKWKSEKQRLSEYTAHVVLRDIRHALAHSNLFFGGESVIQHMYLGSRRENDVTTTKYRVVCGTVAEVAKLVDRWLVNVQKLRVSPYLIWRELDEAA